MRKTLFILTVLLLWGSSKSAFSHGFGAGWLYPKVEFSFKQKNAPPLAAKTRLEKPYEYTQEIMFFIMNEANSFKYDFDTSFFTTKAYKTLLIKEISYEYGGEKKILP